MHNTVRDNFLGVVRVQEGVAAFMPRAPAGEGARQSAAFLMHPCPGCLTTQWLIFPTERCARVPRHFLAAEYKEFFFPFYYLIFLALKKSPSLFAGGKSISADIIKINHSNE